MLLTTVELLKLFPFFSNDPCTHRSYGGDHLFAFSLQRISVRHSEQLPPASVSSASALDRLLLCASSGVAMFYISGSSALAVSGLALFGSGCSISAVSPSSYTTILLSLLPLAVPFGSFRFSLSPSWVSRPWALEFQLSMAGFLLVFR